MRIVALPVFSVNGDSVVPLVTDDESGFEATDK